MPLTKNVMVLEFVNKMRVLAEPDDVVWIDGSAAQLNALREEACATGELIRLDQEKLPGCYYHRSDINDVARMEDRTYICCEEKEDAGPTNNWMEPSEAYSLATRIMQGCMRGRTMYVLPFSMGPVGSPFAKAGIELTDSIYVVLNMEIMTRIGTRVFDALGDSNDFVRGMHSKCNLDAEKRHILHFPQDNAIWSMNSAYGGNALLGKKCFALRIASCQGRAEGWMAEHMVIFGIENPRGETHYIAASFPSACGKTNLAMLVPPKRYAEMGYKVWTLGDDIAWLRVGADGRLWACNAENGFFGVAPYTSMRTNPNAMRSVMRDTIFTNVVLKADKTVWWEKMDLNPPQDALDWMGKPWNPDSGQRGAHPNSRFTAPARNCPSIAENWEDPSGVPLTAIIFGGRRAKTAPLVYQSLNWQHGVFVGSIMASETTAASSGAVGVVRRDPMAMLPFCGYNMGDYWRNWLDMGRKISRQPLIFNVNWFRLDDDSNFIWPGFGENFRVLDWIIRRCEGEAEARETAIGYLPYPGDIDITGIDYEISPGRMFDEEALNGILTVETGLWRDDAYSIKEFYAKFGSRLPSELSYELEMLETRLGQAAQDDGGTFAKGF